MGDSKTFEPGAARVGNFINYYSFNPAEKRLQLIDLKLVEKYLSAEKHLLALDIGCNSGVRKLISF